MKLSKATVDTLKHFGKINPNIWIEAGTLLRTKAVANNILAEATVPDEFPAPVGLYNVNEFLGALSMFSDPELEFSDKGMTIVQGKSRMFYAFAEKKVLTIAEKSIKLPSVDVEFELSNEDLQAVLKAASVLALPEIAIEGDGSAITIAAVSEESPTSNTFSSTVGETALTFKAILKVENFSKLPAGDYAVQISSKKISQFTEKASDTKIWLALEKSSSF